MRCGFSALLAVSLVASASAAAQDMPADEKKFIEIVTAAQAAFKSAPNEMAAGGVRVDRKLKVCRGLSSNAAKGWIGAVKKLTSANDGRGVLEISLAKDVTVGTMNNSFSDARYKTLIQPGSPVYNSAIALKVGARVEFSGNFFDDEDDCFKESSLSLTGSLNAPNYLFRFSSIREVAAPLVRQQWSAEAEEYKGKVGCVVFTEFKRDGRAVLGMEYSTVRRTLVVFGDGDAKSAGIQVDTMPRIPLPDCKENTCIADTAATNNRAVAQMRGGKAAVIDYELKTGTRLGPTWLPLDGFVERMDHAAECRGR